MVTNKGFVRLDLAITREIHEINIANKIYPELDLDVDPNLHIKLEEAPTFEDVRKIINTVGLPYNWHRREEYHNKQSIREISALLDQPSSRRYSFWSGKKEVGAAIIANIEPIENLRDTFTRASLGKKPLALSPEMADNTIEIQKIGLLPEYTNRGWGKHFLPQVLKALFDDKAHYDAVYLNTRNTNHNGVINFYTGFNMNVINARSYADDLISEEALHTKKRSRGGQQGKPHSGRRYTLAVA